MSYKQLYIFVEGIDDERFVKNVLFPQLQTEYDLVKSIQYACLKKVLIENYVKTFNQQASSDYFFLCDMDSHGDKSLCITKRKTKFFSDYNFVESQKLVVVREEIESWYLAGANAESFQLKPISDTEYLDKEAFIKMLPKKFSSVLDFMVEILKSYSIEQAKAHNKSLAYCFNKLL